MRCSRAPLVASGSRWADNNSDLCTTTPPQERAVSRACYPTSTSGTFLWEISAAADRIDKLLAVDPDNQGAVVSDISRQLIVQPLRVLLVTREDDRIVEIYKVALAKR